MIITSASEAGGIGFVATLRVEVAGWVEVDVCVLWMVVGKVVPESESVWLDEVEEFEVDEGVSESLSVSVGVADGFWRVFVVEGITDGFWRVSVLLGVEDGF
jgi:hypothetical protein